MEQARALLGEFLGAQASNLTFVVNATTGFNFPIRSLRLGPGDEVLSTDHEYGALDRAWSYMARERGFTYINHPIPAPLTTPEALVETLWQAVTPRTRVIFFSHITSPTALIFPAELICRRAREAGILTVVDGAHAPGQLKLKLDDIGADFYVGNCTSGATRPRDALSCTRGPRSSTWSSPVVIGWPWTGEPPDAKHYADTSRAWARATCAAS